MSTNYLTTNILIGKLGLPDQYESSDANSFFGEIFFYVIFRYLFGCVIIRNFVE